MLRVEARFIFAQVVDLQTVRNRAAQYFPRYPMYATDTTVPVHMTVAVRRSSAMPFPAAVGIFCKASCDEVAHSFSEFSWHTVNIT